MDRGFTSEDVIDMLAELFAMRGVPRRIRSDNGPEFIAAAIRRWLDQVSVEALYIEPGSPWAPPSACHADNQRSDEEKGA